MGNPQNIITVIIRTQGHSLESDYVGLCQQAFQDQGWNPNMNKTEFFILFQHLTYFRRDYFFNTCWLFSQKTAELVFLKPATTFKVIRTHPFFPCQSLSPSSTNRRGNASLPNNSDLLSRAQEPYHLLPGWHLVQVRLAERQQRTPFPGLLPSKEDRLSTFSLPVEPDKWKESILWKPVEEDTL